MHNIKQCNLLVLGSNSGRFDVVTLIFDSGQCTPSGMTSQFPFRRHFERISKSNTKFSKIAMSSKTLSPSDEMNAQYKKKVPRFPEDVRRVKTNNLLAYSAQHLPMKASTHHVLHEKFYISDFERIVSILCR